MINFTVGPVQSNEKVREIGAQQVPYFRTAEFSKTMLENERLMKKLCHADEHDRVVFMTGSGTASMEAVVMNVLNEQDQVLIVNGGSFGQRFVDLCEIHHINYDQIQLESGKTLTSDDLNQYDKKSYTAFLVNIHETSTGVLYDIDMISEFCHRNQLLLIVDAISSFLADPLDMTQSGIDVIITGSQKALACPPGVSIIVLSQNALHRIENNPTRCMYLDLKDALKNGERGQTPFTPAVSVLLQIHERLVEIHQNGGADVEIAKVKALAEDFRNRIREFPFEIYSNSLSNAVTSLKCHNASAKKIFESLKNHYGIWVCPNGGALADTVFRVGHIGDLTIDDNTQLIDALKDMQSKGLL